MLRALAVAFAVAAVACVGVAVAGMVSGRQSARAGYAVRVLALVCFATAVGLNLAAH